MADLDPIALNVKGVQDLVESPTNKVADGASSMSEGVEGELIDALTLDMDDADLLHLARQWESNYAGYEAALAKRQRANKAYYLGREAEGSPRSTEDKPLASNMLFQAVETFLPAALSKNPEPVVWSDNSTEGTTLSNDVKTMLQYHADVLGLRPKLNAMTRQWLIYFLGVKKYGWNKEINDISDEIRRIQDFIFDKNGYVDADGDFIGHLGERITVPASVMVELFPEHKDYITIQVDGLMGTDCTYTEWWTDEYCFVTYKEKVLDKHKNEFFNYDKVEEDTDPETGEIIPVKTAGRNHFAKPKKPYTFLSVFSLGEQPHDVTGLIEQNIPQQNLITKRTTQIDYNLSRQNNSDAFSEDNFNQETAKQAANAFAKGNPVLVPAGRPIGEAIVRFAAQGFPDAAYKELEMSKENLLSIFGVQGITSQDPTENTTARGMILNQQYDNTRIGGGIGDRLEGVAKNTFNWYVQLYYVYYDEKHFAAVMGQMKAVEFATLQASNINRKLIVSVAPDSMKPHDEITEMNQAVQLWQEGALDPKTLLTILNFPDVQKTSEMTVLWLLDKNAYFQLNFPELAAKLAQMQQQSAAAGVGGSATPPASVGAAPQGQEPTPPSSLGGEPASASLSNVPLPQ